MQHNIVDIITIIVSVVVLVVPLTAMTMACHQVTDTWNVSDNNLNVGRIHEK